MKTKQQIANVLYELDPMGTCCKENELFDEYEKEAEMIASGRSLKAVFFTCFWKGCLNNRQLKEIKEKIDAIV